MDLARWTVAIGLAVVFAGSGLYPKTSSSRLARAGRRTTGPPTSDWSDSPKSSAPSG